MSYGSHLVTSMSRDNETWLAELGQDGLARDQALADLREALLRGLRRSVGGRAQAGEPFLEDMAQEALIRILERLDQFQGRSAFVTWATSVAIRIAMSELRRKRWKDVSLDAVVAEAGLQPAGMVDRGATPQTQAEQQGILAAMHEVIRSELTEKQRTALLAELKGMPQDEIAKHLNSNRNAIYKLTHDARKRLKLGLQQAGYGPEDVHTAFDN